MSDKMDSWEDLPAGDYAIVEIMGHRTMVGRVSEVERFGTKLLMIEPLYRGRLLEPVLNGGGSIYQFTPCTAKTAWEKAPTGDWALPAALRARLEPEALEAPVEHPDVDSIEDYLDENEVA